MCDWIIVDHDLLALGITRDLNALMDDIGLCNIV